jgi:septation ring formation regulator EzrA
MDIFNAYYDEFQTLSKEITTVIDAAEDAGKLSPVESKITELQTVVKQLDIETAGARGMDKKTCQDKAAYCRDTLSKLRKSLIDKKFLLENKGLMGTQSGADRLRMKKANDKLVDQNEMIERALASCADMEENGNVIIGELQNNTEKIKEVREKASVILLYYIEFLSLACICLD